MFTRDPIRFLKEMEFPRPALLLGAMMLLLAAPLVIGADLAAQENDVAVESSSAAADAAAEESAPLEDQLEAAEEVGYEISLEADAEAVPPVPPVPPMPEKHRIRKDTQVVFGSSVRVEENEVARDAVAIGGSVYVDGEARGDAVAVGGSAYIEGEVSGDVVAVGGTVRLGPDAEVAGDVVSVGGTVEIAEGAEIHGQVTEVPFGPGFRFGSSGIGIPDVDVDWGHHQPFFELMGVIWSLIALGVLFLIAALTLLLVRTPVERVAYKAATDPWRSGLVGLLAQILFVPLLVITVLVLVISIIGIPLLLLLPFVLLAILVISILGYTAVAYRIGRWAETRFGWKIDSAFVALLVGVLFIEIWALVGELLGAAGGFLWFFALVFGLLGFLAEYLAWTIGFGAALMTRFGTVGPTGDTATVSAGHSISAESSGASGAAVSPGVAGTAAAAPESQQPSPEPEWSPQPMEEPQSRADGPQGSSPLDETSGESPERSEDSS